MSIPEPKAAELELKEAVLWGAQRCRDAGLPPSRVLLDADLEALSADAFRELARRGWVSEVNNELHAIRSAPPQSSARPGGHPADGRNPRAPWKPLDILVLGAEGGLKRLASFDLADVERLRNEAQAMEAGWAKRRAWAERAAELLRASKRSRIEELKASQVAELSKLAGEAWS